jgi:hypothetical protein
MSIVLGVVVCDAIVKGLEISLMTGEAVVIDGLLRIKFARKDCM